MPERSMTRIKRLAKESSWIVIGQIIVVAGSLVLVRVLTEHLDPAQYGQLALALTLGTLIGQVAFSGAMPGIMRYYTLAVEKNEVHEYFLATIRMMGYGSIVALGLGTVVVLGLLFFSKFDLLGLTGLTILLSVLLNYNTTLSMIQNAARRRGIVAFHGSLDAWLKVVFVSILLTWVSNSPEIVIVGYLASSLLVLGSQGVLSRQLIPGQTPGRKKPSVWTVQIWQYSKPFVFFNAFTWMQASSDRWALNTFSTAHDVGLYAVLIQLGYAPIGMVSGLITTLIGPILFQRSGDTTDTARNADVHKKAWQLTALTLLSTLAACLFAYLFHEWIFRLLVSTQYHSVSNLLPWMILAGGLFSAGQVLGLKLMSDMQTHALIWPKIVTSLVGVLLSVVGAYIDGLTGVIYGAVIFSVLQVAWLGLLSLQPPDGTKN
jgi:O-antigen/teichoic acid export membrane protein